MADPRILYCVGATKAGTSWFYRALADHPECHLRAIKELHYWDTFDPAAQGAQIEALQRRIRDFALARTEAVAAGRDWQVANLDRQIGDTTGLAELLAADRTGDTAYLQFLTGGSRGRLSADITPSYGMLNGTTIRQMAGLSSGSLFVYLIRDPLARLWSHVRMQAARLGATGADLAPAANEILGRIVDNGDERHIAERGDYERTAERLARVLPRGRFRVEFLERLVGPGGFAGMCRFLGIAPVEADTGRRVHEGPAAEMRADLADRALRGLRGQYDWAARTLGPLPADWQANMARALA